MVKDFEFIQRIIAGDTGAFRQVIDQYQRLVNHIVYRMIPDIDEREDICQEVFVKVYSNLDRFRGDSRLSTWIGRIAANRCIDYLQAKKLPLDPEPIEESYSLADHTTERPDKRAERLGLSQVLTKEIAALPAPYKTIITLYHLDDMSYDEIADIMNTPVGTVKSYLFRARRKLRGRLSGKYRNEEL